MYMALNSDPSLSHWAEIRKIAPFVSNYSSHGFDH